MRRLPRNDYYLMGKKRLKTEKKWKKEKGKQMFALLNPVDGDILMIRTSNKIMTFKPFSYSTFSSK